MTDVLNIPLDFQRRLLRESVPRTLRWLRRALDDEDFVRELTERADARLVAGYYDYGSQMYNWEPPLRRDAMLEELVDFLCYASSGGYDIATDG